MNRATGKAGAGCQRLPLRMQAAKGGKKGGVDIDHSVAPGLHKIRVQYAHEAGKADEFDPALAEQRLRLSREGAPVAMRNDRDGNAGRGRDPDTRRLGPAADDERDLGRVGLSRTCRNKGPQLEPLPEISTPTLSRAIAVFWPWGAVAGRPPGGSGC